MSTRTLTDHEYGLAMAWLLDTGTRFPHGLAPGAYPGGQPVYTDQDSWDRAAWNPPGRMPELGIDPDAGDKPTWDEIVAAADSAVWAEALTGKRRELKEECARRIRIAYHASDHRDEVFRRLRGEIPEGADAERDRLRGQYRWLSNTLPLLSLDDLNQYDVSNDTHWEE